MSDHDTALQDALACVRVGPEDFDLGAEVAALRGQDPQVGAVVSFVGTVREWTQAAAPASPPAIMELEHYPGMTEKALAGIVGEAEQRWPLLRVEVLHRVGRLQPGEPIVFVGIASAHRQAAFDACNFIMDYLKTRAPFWKKEDTPEGARWVEGRDSDQDAAARWSRS